MTASSVDLQALELLVEVDERGSLSAAARALRMAQPNASRSINRLERRLGVTLLTRSTGGSRLTAQGTVLVHWARETLDTAQRLLDVAEGLRGEQSAALTVGASLTIAEHLLPRWLGEFRRAHPGTSIQLQMQNSAGVLELVRGGECGLGFIESPGRPTGLRSEVVATDRLVVVVPPDHVLARRCRALTVDELAGTPLVSREPGSGTRDTLDAALEPHGRAAPLLELASGAAILTAVATGVGPAVLSTLTVETAVATGTVQVIDVPGLDISRELRAVWPPPRLTGPASDVVRIARRSQRTG